MAAREITMEEVCFNEGNCAPQPRRKEDPSCRKTNHHRGSYNSQCAASKRRERQVAARAVIIEEVHFYEDKAPQPRTRERQVAARQVTIEEVLLNE